MKTLNVAQFDRSQPDGACETLTIVEIDESHAYYSEALGRTSKYLVQVTPGGISPDGSLEGDSVTLCDLDGEEVAVNTRLLLWDISADVPADVIAAIEDGWATGNNVVTRIV